MSNVDFGRYKRIVRYFWDPEPKNDDCFDAPIWCLGKRYGAKYIFDSNDATSTSRDMVVKNKDRSDCFKDDLNQATVKVGFAAASGGPTDPDQPQTYIDETDRIWPTEFLDDFESRFRFTYRSAFPTISNSSDPSISNPIALSARLRNQLVDKSGFTSDTGWGCMIRSGQSLLANAIGILRLGRGMSC